MKRLLTLFLVLWCSTAWAAGPIDFSKPYARSNPYVLGAGAAAAGCTTMGTMTAWEKLESVPSGGSWTLSDTGSKLSASASGEVATIKCPNGTTDDGSNGMLYDAGSTSQAYIYYTFSGNQTAVSIGFWYKTGTVTSWNVGPLIASVCSVAGCASGVRNTLSDSRSMGDNSRRIIGPETNNVAISDSTWYWITMQWANNAASTWAVYNTSGAQVGTTQSFTGYDGNGVVAQFGAWSSDVQYLTSDSYFDDIVILEEGSALLGP